MSKSRERIIYEDTCSQGGISFIGDITGTHCGQKSSGGLTIRTNSDMECIQEVGKTKGEYMVDMLKYTEKKYARYVRKIRKVEGKYVRSQEIKYMRCREKNHVKSRRS